MAKKMKWLLVEKKRGFGEDGQQNFLTDQLLDFGESGRTHDADQTTSAAKQ